jgi:hypothetical protein
MRSAVRGSAKGDYATTDDEAVTERHLHHLAFHVSRRPGEVEIDDTLSFPVGLDLQLVTLAVDLIVKVCGNAPKGLQRRVGRLAPDDVPCLIPFEGDASLALVHLGAVLRAKPTEVRDGYSSGSH